MTAYAEVSIRELIKWTKHILLGQQHTPDSSAAATAGADSPDQAAVSTAAVSEQLLSDTAWAVYAARFRTAAARAVVAQLLTEKGWPAPPLSSTLGNASDSMDFDVSIKDGSRTVRLGGTAALHWQPTKHYNLTDTETARQLPEVMLQAAAAAHAAVVQLTSQAHFVQVHGVYQVHQSWLQHWLQQLQQLELAGDMQQAGWIGLYLYCSRLRHADARSALAAVFASHFNLQQQAAANLAAVCSGAAAGSTELPPQLAGLQLQQPDPAKPFVLTSRILRAWQVAGRALMAAEPLLVVGRDGSGKSECLRALSWLLGEQLQQFNLTPGEWVCYAGARYTCTAACAVDVCCHGVQLLSAACAVHAHCHRGRVPLLSNHPCLQTFHLIPCLASGCPRLRPCNLICTPRCPTLGIPRRNGAVSACWPVCSS